MKRLLTLLTILLLSLQLSYSQSYTNKPLYYSEVIDVDSVSQEELKERAKIWFSVKRIYSQDLIQNEDNNILIGEGIYEYYNFEINFIVKIYFKDGKYKYVIYDFKHSYNFSDGGFGLLIDIDKNPLPKPKIFGLSQRGWDMDYKNVLDNTKHDSFELIKSLKKSMQLNQEDISDW